MHKYGLRFLLFLTLPILWNCANQTTPTGGPADEKPPKILSSKPKHKETNVTEKTIELEFDEYVNLNNPREEILISPSLSQPPTYKVRKNKVTIESEVPWEENTTYSVSLREGVRDITENNPVENFKLAFSTGAYVDSLNIPGKIKQALTEKIPEKITVAIYQSDTFDIFNHTPNYFTITSPNGRFSIENIKAGNYRIYAFNDKNKNLKVESRSEMFGFLSDTINLSGKLDSLTIPLVNLDTRKLQMINQRNNSQLTLIKFSKYISNYTLDYSYPEKLIDSYGDDQTEITLYFPTSFTDSLSLNLHAEDSLNFKIDTTFYIKRTDTNPIPSAFTVSSNQATYNLDKKAIVQELKLTKPLAHITLDSIYIQKDSLTVIPFAPEDFIYDSIHKKLTLHKLIPLDTLFADPKSKPALLMGKGAFISIEGDSSKSKQQALNPVQSDQTGILLIEVQTEEPHYIIQLLNPQNQIVKEVRDVNNYSFTNLQPLTYKIRVILDRNNNGKWDIGNIFQNIEPESTYYYTSSEGKYEFPIRANWEYGPLMLIF